MVVIEAVKIERFCNAMQLVPPQYVKDILDVVGDLAKTVRIADANVNRLQGIIKDLADRNEEELKKFEEYANEQDR